ncbi:unnamed protein product [Symbiodinium sp. KB8]|nr:unnamed protein product [Symbiodinium sp. KB8]
MRGVGLHSDGKPASFDERVAQHVSLAHDMMVEAAGKIPKLPQGFSLGSPLTRSMQQDLADGKRQAKGGGKGKRSLGETLTKRASKLLKERCSGKALSRAGRGKGSGKGKGGKGRGKNGKSKKALGQAAKNAEPKKKPGRQAKSQQKPSKNPKQPKRARKAQPDAAVVGKPWDALNDQLRQLEIGQQQTCDGHGNWGPVEKSLRDMAKPLIYRLPRWYIMPYWSKGVVGLRQGGYTGPQAGLLQSRPDWTPSTVEFREKMSEMWQCAFKELTACVKIAVAHMLVLGFVMPRSSVRLAGGSHALGNAGVLDPGSGSFPRSLDA